MITASSAASVSGLVMNSWGSCHHFCRKGVARTVEPPCDEARETVLAVVLCINSLPNRMYFMEDQGMERRIDKWKRTLKLKACKNCGRPFITFAEIDFMQTKAKNPPPEEWFDYCPDCR